MPVIDDLQIKIQGDAVRANDAIDKLAGKLDRLSEALNGLNGKSLSSLSNGVTRLSTAMTAMNNVKTADFTRLAKNMEKMADLDSGKIGNAASAMHQFVNSLDALEKINVSDKSMQIAELAKGISSLGYKSSTQAIQNIPQLASAISQLMSTLSKAPKVSQNLIDMTNALAKLSRTGASSGKAATSLGRSLDTYTKSSKRAKIGTFSLASAIGKLYATYWMLFRAFGKIKEAINISSQLTEVQNVVDVTFGKYADLVDKMSEISINQFGMSELSVKKISSTFQAMGTAMGFAQDEMANMSIDLTKLTADMASFYNVEQDAVAEDLASIFTGSTRPLRQYGLDLTHATLQEWAMKQGIDANVKSMSQAEKTMLRFQYVLANTGAAQGDFLRTADTWANQTRILKQNFQQLGAVIGGTFINMLKPFVKALNNAMSHIIAFAKVVSNALGKIFGWTYEEGGGGIASDMEYAADSSEDLAGGLSDAEKNAKKLKSHLLGIDELNVVEPDTGDTGSGSGGGGGAGAGGAGADGGQWVKSESILKNFESEIDNLEKLGNTIRDSLIRAMESINWQDVYEKARGFGSGLAEFLNGLLDYDKEGRTLFGEIGKTLAKTLNTVVYAAQSFLTDFDFYQFGVNLADGINRFFENFDFRTLAKTLNIWAKGIWKTATTAIKKIKWKNLFADIFDFIDELDLSTIFLLTIPNIKSISKPVGELSKKFTTLTTAVKLLSETFSEGFVSGIRKISESLTLFQKMGATALLSFAEFKVVSDVFENLKTGTEDLAAGIAKIGTTVAVVGASLTAVLGFPTGVIATALVGLAGAFQGLSDAEKALVEQSEIEKYGNTIFNLTEKISDASNAVKLRAEASMEYVQTVGAAEAAMASDLADKYFDLAEKESLTNKEKEEMKNLASMLVDTLPSLDAYYNTQTGLIDATRATVDELIESRLKEIQLAAVEDKLKEAYGDLSEQLIKVEEATALAGEQQDKMNKLSEEYREAVSKLDAYSQWKNISRQINDGTENTEELLEKQKELWKILTSNGTESFPTFEALSSDVSEAEGKINSFKEKYEAAMGSLMSAEESYSLVEGNISRFTEMLTIGMTTAAQDSASGYADTLSKDTTMEDATLEKARALLKAFRSKDGIDSHSPSKAFEAAGKDSIDGYILGLTENEGNLLNAITEIAQVSLNKFAEIAILMHEIYANAIQELCNGFSSIEENAAPWFTEEKWLELYDTIRSSLETKWGEVKEWWSGTAIVSWWEEDVKPWFTLEKWSGVFRNIWDALKSIWTQTATWWQNTAMVTWWNNNVSPWFTKSKWESLLKTIPNEFKNAFEKAKTWVIEKVQSMWDFVNGIIDKIKSAISSIGSSISSEVAGLSSLGGKSRSVEGFATGGFPEPSSLFWAGENGVPEILGTVGGRTAVAGGAEITGIRDAVYDVGQNETALLQMAVSLLEVIANKDTSVNIDGRTLVDAYDERKARNGFSFT